MERSIKPEESLRIIIIDTIWGEILSSQRCLARAQLDAIWTDSEAYALRRDASREKVLPVPRRETPQDSVILHPSTHLDKWPYDSVIVRSQQL